MASSWSYHTAKINSVDWTPNSRNIATGSLDTNLIIWYPETPTQKLTIKGKTRLHKECNYWFWCSLSNVDWLDSTSDSNSGGGGGGWCLNVQVFTSYSVVLGAHPLSQITRVQWIDDNTLVSSGHDSCLRIWTIAHK